VHLELGRDEPLPFVPSRYSSLRVLARLRGVPIGAVTVPKPGGPMSAGRLRQELAAKFAERIWEERLVEGATAGLAPPAETPSISVVVCTRERADLLAGCLAALSEQDYPFFEVIVVDNAPASDAVRRVAEQYGVRYVVEPNPGLDLARNRGLASSSSEIVAFTDDDARPDRGWLAAIAAGFSSPDVCGVSGLVVAAELETRAQGLFEEAYGGMGKGFRARVHSRRGRSMKFAPNALGTGCNMAFRRETLAEIGGFDPALDVGTVTGGGGDLDALQRILETGNAVVYRPDALVSHLHRRTVKQLRRQIFDNGRAYSAVLTTAFLRARGLDRLRVVYAFLRWLGSWHLRRMVKRLVGRERLPLRLIAAETVGAPCGPFVYALARRRARRVDGQAD
jgi:glycosyltransferase involved in cell wall biosynthesis